MVWWGEVPEGGDICIHIADLCCCTAETNTALQSNYTPFFKKKYVSRKNPWFLPPSWLKCSGLGKHTAQLEEGDLRQLEAPPAHVAGSGKISL